MLTGGESAKRTARYFFEKEAFMKFISLSKTGEFPDILKNILKEEFSLASRAGEGRMGETHLFYRYFINVKYIAWSRIRKAYLRVESGESGEFLLKEFYLMLQLDDESEAKLRFEREENARCILAYLQEHYPQTEIGYRKPR